MPVIKASDKRFNTQELTLCEHLEKHNCQCYIHYQNQQNQLLAWKPVLEMRKRDREGEKMRGNAKENELLILFIAMC